jgi:hypothetical protein
MLMLAGLVGPLVAQENEITPQAPAAKIKPASAIAYAGISPAVVTELARRGVTSKDVPPGVGVMVAFVDPKGPSMGIFAEDDILIRLDDQVLVNPEQFRALIGMHQPGDVVKIVAVREDEVVKVDLKLGTRNIPAAAAPKAKKPAAPKVEAKAGDVTTPAEGARVENPPRMGLTINGQTFEVAPGTNGQVIILDPMSGFPLKLFNNLMKCACVVWPYHTWLNPKLHPKKSPLLQPVAPPFNPSLNHSHLVSVMAHRCHPAVLLRIKTVQWL